MVNHTVVVFLVVGSLAVAVPWVYGVMTILVSYTNIFKTSKLPEWPDYQTGVNFYIWNEDGRTKMGTLEEMRSAQERKDKP